MGTGPVTLILFQLTTSRRGRQEPFPMQRYFNSRPHEEVDQFVHGFRDFLNISTHDLTKRSTWLHSAHFTIEVFQLTTSRRGRPDMSPPASAKKYFNSRPHEEVDRKGVCKNEVVHDFNSRPHEEVDGKSTQITPYFCSYIWHILPKHTTQLHTTIFIYFFFQQILSKTRCESSTISCLLHARTGRSSFQKIKVSVTSNPGLAPICSTLF